MQADLHAATPASSPNYEPAALSGAVLPLRLPQTSRRCGSCSAASYLPTYLLLHREKIGNPEPQHAEPNRHGRSHSTMTFASCPGGCFNSP